MRPRVVAVIQARMGSTRLPGKVLRTLGQRTVLEWVMRAARSAREVDDVVVATSVLDDDDAIVRVATDAGVRVVRGSATDVVSRFALAAESASADAVVRLTADCPLADPRLIDQVVALWRADVGLAYVATTLERSLPRGLDVELITRDALDAADATAVGYDRVHVTSLVYATGSAWPRAGVVVRPSRSDLRVTLDTPEDLLALEALTSLLPDAPGSWREIVAALDAHPDIVALNAHVEQKRLEEG